MTETVKLQGSTAGVSWSIWVPENHAKTLAEPLTKIHEALIHVCAHGGASAHTQPRVLDGKPFIKKEEEKSKPKGLRKVSADGLQLSDTISVADSSDDEHEALRSQRRQDIDTIVRHWQHLWMDRPDREPSKVRLAAAAKALNFGFCVDEICDSIRGYRYSRFHLGDNEHGTTYNGLKTLLASEDRIEAGLQFLEDHEGEPMPEHNHRKAVIACKERLAKHQALHAAEDLFGLFHTKKGAPGKALARWRFWQPLADAADEFPNQIHRAIEAALSRGTTNPKFVRAECIRLSRLSDAPLKDLSREQKEQRSQQQIAESYRKLGLPVPSA